MHNSLSSSHGLVETAAYADGLQTLGIKTSNFMSGVIHDLTVGSAIAFLALVLMVSGLGSKQDDQTPTTPIPTNSLPALTVPVDTAPIPSRLSP